MSLLKKASIITTPTAYAEDYLYSIKPAYDLGSELVVNGDGSSTTGWSLAYANTTLSINNNNLRATANASGAYGLSQSLSLNTSKKYIITADINVDNASGGTGNLRIATNVQLGTNVTTLSTATGITTTTFTPTASTMYIGIVDTASSSSNYVEISNISVKEVTDADFDFDRNSTGTRVNEDYLIEDVPYNLTTYSEDFSQWTLNGDSVVLQSETYLGRPIYKLTDATGVLGIYNDNTGNIVGQTYTISLIAKKDTSNVITLRYGSSNNKNVQFNLNTGVITSEASGVTGAIQNLGNGFYQISSTIASLIHSTISYAIYTDNGSVLITSAQIVKGDQLKDYLKTTDRLDIPRIDYTNGEPSILLEPSRQNIITNSNSNNLNFALDQTSMTYNQIVSPEGLNNGILFEQTGSTASNSAYNFGLPTTDGTYTYSIFIKAKDSTKVRFYFSDGSALAQDLNPTNMREGVISGNLNLELKAYSNGWFRVSFSRTLSSASTHRFSIYPDYNNTQKGVYIYGLQVEVGSYATSLIHTSGGAVTRSADAANNAGNSDLINSTEGVLYAEIKSFIETPTHRKTIALSDATSSQNVVRIFYLNNTANQIRVQVRANNSLTASLSKIVQTTLEYHKVAIKYKENDFALWVDGVQAQTHTNGAVPSANTMFSLDFSDGNDTNNFNEGAIKMVAVFKEALTDLELEKLTGYNNHELYMNYYNRLSYLGLAEEYNVESDINNYIL